MAKVKTSYVCSECGYECARWLGKCPSCSSWNTLEETVVTPEPAKSFAKGFSMNSTLASFDKAMSPIKICDVDVDNEIRYDTGLSELNRVLGGGIVKGSVILLGGDPGIGKSTLMLQICEFLGEDLSVLYISGEESVRQIKLRADRLNVTTENLSLLALTDVESIIHTIMQSKPDVVIVDSIQTLVIGGVNSSAGSVVQVRESTNALMKCAKSEGVPIFIVGHVNKDGAIAGPKVLEHIVDAVLHFEGERHLSYRILRAVKNRYGSTNEIGVFEMDTDGLTQVENPSEMLLSGRPIGVSGTSIACAMEGSRPILAEIQALATKTGFAVARRMSSGLDYNRLALLIAVLEKRGGFYLGNLDVFVNIVGGLKIDDPAVCLPVILSLYSNIRDIEIDKYTAAFGEVGLAGECRNVTHIEQRISELERLGFTRCILPKISLSKIKTKHNIELIGVSNIKDAFRVIDNKKENNS